MNSNFINPIKTFFRALGRLFWQKIFLFFFLFLFFDFLFAGILFVEYYYKNSSSNQTNGSLTLLDQGLLDKTLSRWEAGRAVIQQLPAKQYPDFFQDFSTSSPAIIATSSAATTTAATTTATSSR